jgi:1-acyl-sn-glycerol-3-phosphate acyltransferase
VKLFYRLCWLLVRIFLAVYCRLRTSGMENIPEEGGFILASNHIAAGDPPFLGAAIGREMYFLAKKELFKNPMLGLLIRNLNAIPVDRGVFDRRALSLSLQKLRGGFGLILFPEGTRSKTGKLGRGKPGIGMLALEAGVPIVPARIENSRKFLRLPFSGKRLIMRFGSPIPPGFLARFENSKEGYRALVQEVMDRIGLLENDQESERVISP